MNIIQSIFRSQNVMNGMANGFEETIANFQWFLRRPSPLNVFGRSDHCHQWFYDGFLMLLPSLSMVFDGSGPLVKRCDGFDGSLWSMLYYTGRQTIEQCDNSEKDAM